MTQETKDLINAKISEALSAVFDSFPRENWQYTNTDYIHAYQAWMEVCKQYDERDPMANTGAALMMLREQAFNRVKMVENELIRAEKEKRESEIKSALETIDWGEILR